MTSTIWPDHLLTFEEWTALPEDNRFHVEIVEGVLLVSPRPLSLHQRAVTRLSYLIDAQLPDKFSALAESEVVIGRRPPTVRIPDVLITTAELLGQNPARHEAGDILLALEVLSEGSVRTDRVTKFAEYAEVGIEHYWIVDLDQPASLEVYRLIDGHYERFGEFSGVATIEFEGTPITLDLNALTTRRAQRP